MAIEILRDLLKVDQVVGEELSQYMAEGDILVPEDKPGIAKVLDISGRVYITGQEVVQGKVMVEGVIRFNVLYIAKGDNQPITSVESEINFTHYIEVADVTAKMTAQIKVEIEHVDFEELNDRKLNVKAALNMQCQVRQILQLEAAHGFVGDEGIQMLKERVRTTSSGGSGSGQTILRDDIELSDDMPSIQEVLRKSALVRVLERKVADNRIIAHGEIDLKFLYLCGEEDEPIQSFEQEIPFSHFVEIPGAYQGMDSIVDVLIQDLDVIVREDINGERRIMGVEMILSMNGQVFETEDKEIVLDAFSPGKKLELEKRKIRLTRMTGENQSQAVIKESVSLPDNIPSVSRILYMESNPILTDYSIQEGKVVMEGILATNIIYQSEDAGTLIGNFKEDIPFIHTMEMEGVTNAMECESELMVQHMTHTIMAPNEVELKIVLSARMTAFDSIEKEVLLNVEEVEGSDILSSGIFIYFVQPGDSLWAVAKRYNTTIANILKYNEVENQDELEPGTKIIVYKKLDTSIA